jgi:hypothetical protein
MSLLSSPQGAPDRVWSVLGALEANGGRLSRPALLAWINPVFVQGGIARTITGEPDGQALGSASSLELVHRDGGDYQLTRTAPASFRVFADEVHDRLCRIGSEDPDFVVLQVFAFVVAETDRRRSTLWLMINAVDLADTINVGLGEQSESQTDRAFNTSKMAAWRRWLAFLGLITELPDRMSFYPYVADRLLRELVRANLPRGEEIPAARLLEVVARRLPYLDGGLLHAAATTGDRPAGRRLSRVLSTALRDLHDEGTIEIRVRGDAADVHELAPDLHPLKSLQSIVLKATLDD